MASTATEDVTIAAGGGDVTVDVDVKVTVSDDVRVDVDANANANANADGKETPANNISPTSSSSNSGEDNDTSKPNPHSSKSNSTSNKYYVAEQPKDENLPNNIKDDPRGEDPTKRITKKASSRGAGRNTESFDPASTLVRPAMRVVVGNPNVERFNKTLKHDDVVIVPELFGPEDNWDLYYQLVSEITELQNSQIKNSDFIPWHEGAHLICKSPSQSTTFQQIISKLCDYFNIDASSAGTRFNWYKDSSDWKPFHHDSAAFNPKRAKSQNITVGVSFGATRELAFIRACDNNNSNNKHQGQGQQGQQQDPVRLYFPQTNNGVFTFGRDVNILWKHGVNALLPEEQDGKGRISIILWGLARDVVEEEGSPPLLGSDGQGPHASSSNHHHHHRNSHRRGGGRGGGGHGGGHGRRKNGGGSGGGGNGRRDSSGSNKKRRFEDNDNDYYGRRGDDYDRRGGGDYRYDDRDRSRGRDGGHEQRRDYYGDNNNSHQRHRHDDDHRRGGGSGGGGHHNHHRHHR